MSKEDRVIEAHRDFGEHPPISGIDEISAILELPTDEAREELISLKTKYSLPFPARTSGELELLYPKVEPYGGRYIVDNGDEVLLFDSEGRETQVSLYEQTHHAHARAFDEYQRRIIDYDPAGYIHTEIEMTPRRLGFLHTYFYGELADGGRELARIEIWRVGRVGLMDPGDIVNKKPTVLSLCNVPFIKSELSSVSLPGFSD